MNTKFDELAKGSAQSVTRRQALKRFGVGLAGMALACFGLASTARAVTMTQQCKDCISYCVGITGQSHAWCRTQYCGTICNYP